MKDDTTKAAYLFAAMNERFPIEDMAPTPQNRGMEQIYKVFCQRVAGIKPKRVLNLVAQHLNSGKHMGRALADIMEFFDEQERSKQQTNSVSVEEN